MIDREDARRICEQALQLSTADACEVFLAGGRDAVTRFANNEIHQNMASESYELVVRSLFGRRTGTASSNRLDAEGIARVVAESERVTHLMPERDDLLELPEPQPIRELPDAHDPATAELGPDAAAELARQVVAIAAERGLTAAGIVRRIEGEVGEYGEKGTIAMASSKGLFAYHPQTSLQVTATAMGSDSSGWADSMAHAAADVDAGRVGRIAAEKALASAAPRPVAPGEHTVVLEPAAVAELLAFTMFDWSATVVDEGRSFLSGRTGTRLFGSNIRITDDAAHPLHRDRPFDEEGMPTTRVTLVEGGEHRELVYDRIAAQRHGKQPTGHGLRIPSTEGAVASHLVLEGGPTTLEAMIRNTERGILVTRFWYTRPVDPYRLLITGMTRDGTFWIEDGEIRHGIRNLRFNQSLVDLLQHVTALGPQVFAFPCVVPPLRAEGFRFTSETTF